MKLWKNGKSTNKLGKILTSVALVLASSLGLTKVASETHAISKYDTTSYVKVGELFDMDSQSMDATNLDVLMKYISGNSTATISDIDAMATDVSDASVIRAKTLDAGTSGSTEYTAKTAEQDIIVRLGGLDWQVMYLSKDNDGNSILTLWLDNSKQDAWTDRTSDEGEYYGFIDGALYSSWASWKSSSTSNYPSNMYGASYINAVTLNNGGANFTSESTVTTGIEKSADNPFAYFTMEQFGLTEYLVIPRNVSWQENQSAKTIINSSYNYSNDAWSKDTPDDGFYLPFYNYAKKIYYDAWADSYIWLPSMAETGYDDSHIGLWKTSRKQRKDYDGFSYGNLYKYVGKSSVSAYPNFWLRSSDYDSVYETQCLYPTADKSIIFTVTSGLAVRPSLHLNLSEAVDSMNGEPIVDGEISIDSTTHEYDGVARTPGVSVTLNGNQLIENVDFKVLYKLNGVTVPEIKDAGEYKVIAKGIGSYRRTLKTTYTVTPKDIGLTTVMDITGIVYTGSAIIPTVTIIDGESTLELNTDYTVSGSDNVNAGTATITITGIGNYNDTTTKTFTINPLNMSSSSITNTSVSSQVYTGSQITPSVTVKFGSTTLTKNTDYTLTYENNINVGTATITIAGTGNFTGTREVTFTITKRDISSGTLSVSSATYTGDELKPTLTLKVYYKYLTLDTDFTAVYTNNLNAGTGKVVVTGINNYSGSITTTFTIEKRSIGSAGYTSIANQEYTSTYIKPALDLKYSGHNLVEGTHYTTEYSDNISIGTASILVTGIGNFTGTRTITFKIVQHNISNDELTFNYDSFAYTGSSVSIGETLKSGNVTLIKNTDYTMVIRKGSLTGSIVESAVDIGTYYVVLTGKGNYTGTISKSFEITTVDLTDNASVILGQTSFQYSGESIVPSFQVKLKSNVVLSANDYTYKILHAGVESTAIDLGEYVVEVTGKNGYTGSATNTFTIVAKDITNAVITLEKSVYMYSSQEILASISSVTLGDMTLGDSDYTVAYSNNIGAGDKALVTITGKNNYTGSASTYFTIEKAVIGKIEFVVGSVNSENGSLTLTYTGNTITPTITVYNTEGKVLSALDYVVEYKRDNEITTNLTYVGVISIVVSPTVNTNTNSTNLSGVAIGSINIEPINLSNAYIEVTGSYTYNNTAIIPTFNVYTDDSKTTKCDSTMYNVEVSNNINAGSGNIVVSFTGNYTGVVYATFTIGKRDISNLKFSLDIPTLIYDGTPKTINWSVADDNGANLDDQLVANYINNTNAGMGTITFNGVNNYTGEISKTFEISPASIENMTISAISDQLYTGSSIKPQVVVKIDENSTLDSSNYTVSYSGNILIGVASVVVTGTGNYSGQLTTTFNIVSVDISLSSVGDIDSQTFTMSQITPKPTLTYAGARLLENTDYTLSYTDNIYVGTATITITGIGCFKGTTTKTFNILPADISNVSIRNMQSGYVYTGSEINTLHVNNTFFLGNLVSSTGDGQLIEVTYKNNINVGTATIEITPFVDADGNSQFTGKKEITFNITKANLTLDMLELGTLYYEYSGLNIKPIPTITYNSNKLVMDTDYTLTYDTDTINVGTKALLVSAVENSNFVGSLTIKYYITAKSIANVSVDSIEDKVYIRGEITTTVNVYDGEKLLTLGTDYTLEFSNNINVGDAIVVIRGKGNYLSTTTKSTTFKITPAVITSLELDKTQGVYNRKEQIITAKSVKAGELEVLDNEYKLEYTPTNIIDAGVIKVNVISTSDNFVIGTEIFAEFTIEKAIISTAYLNTVKTVYNMTEQKPVITKVVSENNLTLSTDEYTLMYFRGENVTTDFVNAGAITVKVLSNSDNFTIADDVICEFTITPKPITDSDITIKYYFVEYDAELGDYKMLDLNGDGKRDYMLEDQVYIAYLVHPEIIFGASVDELEKGVDYNFTILNTVLDKDIETSTQFVNVGEYVVTISAINNYSGTITKNFKVNTREFSVENVDVTFKNGKDFTYTGSLIKLDLANDLLLTYTQDGVSHEIVLEGSTEDTGAFTYRLYNQKTLTYTENGEQVTVTFDEGNYGYINNLNTGSARIYLQGVNNFDGVICIEFNITPIDITNESAIFELSDTSNLIYSTVAQTPNVTKAEYNSVALIDGKDYTVSYSNNINASTNAKVIITGINNYTGKIEKVFTIAQKTLSSSMVDGVNNVYFNGLEQNPDLDLIYNSVVLLENSDYTMTYSENADFVNAGETIIKFKAVENGNYTGEFDYVYKILPKTLRSITLRASRGVYNRNAHTVSFVIKDMDNLIVAQNDSNLDIKYYLETDLNTAISSMTTVGNYRIVVTGLNNYSGEVSATYTIAKASVGFEMLTTIANQTYTGQQITPDIVMTYLDEVMENGVDYTFSYSNNINVGVAEVKILGTGNFGGEFTGYFNILPKDLSEITYDESKSLTAVYTGLSVTPSVDNFVDLLKFNDYSLVDGVDFIVYTTNNCVNVGKYSLQIKGIGNYTGILSKEFSITPLDLSNDSIIVSGVVDTEYTGLDITQSSLSISNTLSNSLLFVGRDFTVKYSNNRNVVWGDVNEEQSAIIEITAVAGGNYTGTKTVKFCILAKSLEDSDITVASISPVVYTGLAHEPKPEVKFNALVLGEDIITYSWENNIEYGRASVIITAKPNTNYKGSITRYFEIGLTEMTDIEITGIESELVYNGAEQKQTPILTKDGKTLVLDTDYTLTYSSDVTNVGTVTITIKGINNYSGVTQKTYSIVPLELSQNKVIISDINDYEFTGSSVTPNVEIKYNGKVLDMSLDYVLTYSNNINVTNEAVVSIEFVGNYTGTATQTFKITAKSISADMVSGLTSQIYTGKEITPSFSIIYNLKDYLQENNMFELTFRNNIQVGTAYIDIVGKNNFSGTITVEFEICAKSLTQSDIDIELQQEYVYTGVAITPNFVISLKDGTELSYANDYTFALGNNTNAGDGEIYITFKGNYAGNVTKIFRIGAVDLTSSSILNSVTGNLTYNATNQIADFEIKFGEYTLGSNDYTVTYLRQGVDTSDLANVGEITIRLTGKNNFAGVLDLNYSITAKLLDSEDIHVGITSTNLTYSGTEICPEIVVSMGAIILNKDVDYTISYENNINVSDNAKIIITAVNGSNYMGNKQISFSITSKALTSDMFEIIVDQEFTSDEITPNLIASYNEKNLQKDIDYTVSFSNNVKVGTANVIIAGIGNFNGSISKDFQIVPANISNATVSGLNKSYVYNMDIIRPNVVVSINNKTLELGVDYNLDYCEDLINVGTKTFVVIGINNYKNSITLEFNITPKNIGDDDIVVTGIENKNYSFGAEITQDFALKLANNIIYSADSYDVEYSNNINAGTGRILITGKNNFTGNKTITFTISKIDSVAYIGCADEDLFEGNRINLKVLDSSTPGYVIANLTTYVAGDYEYTWTFIPNDKVNFNEVSGKIKLTATALKVIGLQFGGDYKTKYSAYDKLDLTNLVVYLEYNSGKTEILSKEKYTVSVDVNDLLEVGDIVTITYTLDENISSILPIEITSRIVTIANDFSKNLVATGTKQYIDLKFNNGVASKPVEYSIVYFNLDTNTYSEYILGSGKYRIEINILDSNYSLENNFIEIEVNSRTISSMDNTMSIESAEGFTKSDTFNYSTTADSNTALKENNLQSFDVNGKFLSAYYLKLGKSLDITLKFKPNVSDVSKLQIYKLNNGALQKLTFNVLDDGSISLNCSSEDKLFLFEASEEATGVSTWWIYLTIALVFVSLISIISAIVNKSKRKHAMSVELTQKTNTAMDNNKQKDNTQTHKYSYTEPVSNGVTFIGKDSLKISGTPTKTSDSIKPYVQPQNNANQTNLNNVNQSNLNNEQRTNSNTTQKNMPSKAELIRMYVIYDENGNISGIKDGAPESLKKAFEKFKQEREDK